MTSQEKNNQKTSEAQRSQKNRVQQTALPLFSLEDALVVATSIKNQFAGQPSAPLLVAEACGISPTSSNWRYIAGCSAAYGVTEGGYNAQVIKLTDLGERIVAPLKEGDDILAKREAVLIPSILSDFYKTYNNNKLPRKDIGLNVLQKKGVPVDRLESTWNILRKNAEYVGFLRVISGNEYIYLDVPQPRQVEQVEQVSQQVQPAAIETIGSTEQLPQELMTRLNISEPASQEAKTSTPPQREKPNIFISHGKNSQVIVGQLKELLCYGQMNPIVSV